MPIAEFSAVKEALKALVARVSSEVATRLAGDAIRPEKVEIRRPRVMELEDQGYGSVSYKTQWEDDAVEVWTRASGEVQLAVEGTDEFKRAAELALPEMKVGTSWKMFGTSWRDYYLKVLVRNVAHNRFAKASLPDDEIERIAELTAREALCRPIHLWLKIGLRALGLPAEPIQLEAAPAAIVLRRVTAEDIEEELRQGVSGNAYHSAVARLDWQGTDWNQMDNVPGKIEAALRLRRPGGARLVFYRRFSESLVWGDGGAYRPLPWDEIVSNTIITPDMAARLPAYWRTMSSVMPTRFYTLQTSQSLDPTELA
jgi:hypothetical protein